jgi:F-type H+-transporting ATPase subunit b
MTTLLTVLLNSEEGGLSLLLPKPGMALWTLVVFLMLVFVLGKFAFKPIVQALKDREDDINAKLAEAQKARAEMASLTAKNEELLNQAKEERNKIIAEAREAADKLKNDMLERAQTEAMKKMSDAFREIETQKNAAIVEIKNTVGQMALGIAEKVVRKEISNDASQKELVEKLVKETNLN